MGSYILIPEKKKEREKKWELEREKDRMRDAWPAEMNSWRQKETGSAHPAAKIIACSGPVLSCQIFGRRSETYPWDML